jgi:hypothetical protein
VRIGFLRGLRRRDYLRISTPWRGSVCRMDSSDRNTTQEPAGKVTQPESLATAPRRVDRHELVRPLSHSRTTDTSADARAHGQAAVANGRPEPGTWKTLGTIVFDAPSEFAPCFGSAERGNPLVLALALAAVVAVLTVAAVTAFLLTRPTSRPDASSRTFTVGHGDSVRIGAFEPVRGNHAQVATRRVADPPPRSVRGGGVAPGA